MKLKNYKFWIRYSLSLILAIVIIYFIFSFMDIPILIKSLKNANIYPFLLACFLNFFVMASKGIRWYFVVKPHVRISPFQAVRLTILAFFINSFIPARGGDIMRGIVAAKETGGDAVTSIASVGADKLMDMITVFFLALGFPFLPELPGWVKEGTLFSLIGAYGLFILVIILSLKGHKYFEERKNVRIYRVMHKLSSGLRAISNPRIFVILVLFSLLSYGFQLAMVFLSSLSAGIRLSLPECACALLILNIAVSVPLTPLNLGTLHAAFTAILVFFGFNKESAMISSVVIHLAYTLPLFAISPFLGVGTIMKQYRPQSTST